jgi:phage terminase large subunit GpA-like protein
MSTNLAKKLTETRQKTLKPSPKLTLVQWADQYRFLSSESSSNPGRWKTSLVEAARGPMEAVTDPKVKRISIMACTQLMKTELLNNIVGYYVHQDPSPIIVMQPTVSLAETWSKDRLDPMIRDTPVLAELINPKKSRDSGNTISHKQFPGGHITVIGSNSPSELASRPVRITLRDEVDKYGDSAGDEGDPSSLIRERSATFWNRLDVGVCSPTVTGRSAIEQEYLASDQRKFHVDCPYCGHNHFMVWANVKWEGKDASTAHYECPECKAKWTEIDRLNAIAGGAYVAYAPFKGHAGFHVNKLASPWEPLSELVQKWLDSENDLEKRKTFINTQLAETWQERGEAPEHMRLYERAEKYMGTVPEGVLFLTAGADVQKDRIEVEIVGWGRNKESWSIDYRVFMGETSGEKPWRELDLLLSEQFEMANGLTTTIRKLAVDSGFNTQHVYNWARKHLSSNRVMAVKGSDALNTLLGHPKATEQKSDGTQFKKPVRVFPVGVSIIKEELYGWLGQDGAKDDGIYPHGYCHFPEYGEEYFKMLTAEEKVKSSKNGRAVYRWVKTYARNEALDCRVYARAAASNFGLDRFKDADWDALQGLHLKPSEIKQKIVQKTPVVSAPKPRITGFSLPNRRE